MIQGNSSPRYDEEKHAERIKSLSQKILQQQRESSEYGLAKTIHHQNHTPKTLPFLMELYLNSMVDSPPFHVEKSFSIQQPDYFILLLYLIPYLRVREQIELLDKFIVILEESMRNCYVLTKSGVIGVITDLIRRRELFVFSTHTTNQFFRLIGILGGFSITVKELKGLLHFVLKEDMSGYFTPKSSKENFELDPEHAPMILEILLKMSRNSYPQSFFNFNGRTTGLVLDAPSLDFPKNGYTFSCWMRIENAKSTVPIRIFSIFDEAENGMDCYFFQNKIAIQIPKARKNVVFNSMNFVTGRWYLINIVHFKQRKRIIFKKCMVRLYVNGEYMEEKEFPFPNFSTTIQFADIGSNRPVDIDPPDKSPNQRKKRRSTRKITSQYLFSGFCGQMSAICFMSLPLRRDDIATLFLKGPDYQYDFVEKSEFEFRKSVFLLYNPRTARSRCQNNAPMSRNVEAKVLKGTQSLVTHTIRDTLTCIGGFEVLYCFFEGLMTPSSTPSLSRVSSSSSLNYGDNVISDWTIETGLCARLITLIAQLMYGTEAKEEMEMRGGIQTLALLLGKLPVKQVNINAFKALQGLVQPMEVGSVLWKDVFRHIFMNFPLWIRCDFALQKELLEFLYENMRKKPRVLEEIRELTNGVGFWLDALRLYYYYPEEIERWSQPEYDRGVKHEEIKDLRKMYLLPIIRLYLVPPIDVQIISPPISSSSRRKFGSPSSNSSGSTPGSPVSDSEAPLKHQHLMKMKKKKRTSQSVSADRFRKKMSKKKLKKSRKSKKKNKKSEKDDGGRKSKKSKKFMEISSSSSNHSSNTLPPGLTYSSSTGSMTGSLRRGLLFPTNTMRKKENMMILEQRKKMEEDLLSIIGFLASSRSRVMQQMEVLELMFDILDYVYTTSHNSTSSMIFNVEVVHLIAKDDFMKLLVELVKSFESEDLVLLYVKFMSKIADCVRLLDHGNQRSEYLNQMSRISNYFKIMLSGCKLTTKVYNTILDVLFGCFETLEIRRSPQELWEFSRTKNVKGLEIKFIGILDTLFQFLVRGTGEVRHPSPSSGGGSGESPKKKKKNNRKGIRKRLMDDDHDHDNEDDEYEEVEGEHEQLNDNYYNSNVTVIEEEEEDDVAVDEDGSVVMNTVGGSAASSKRRKKLKPMEIRRKAVRDINRIVKSNRMNRNQILEFTKNWDYKLLSLVLPFGSPFNSKTVYGEIVPQVIESIVLLVNEEMMFFFDEETREELQSKPSRSNFSASSSSSINNNNSNPTISDVLSSPTSHSTTHSHSGGGSELTRFWKNVLFSCLEGMKLVCEDIEEFDFKRFQVEFYEMMFPFFFVKVEKIVNSAIENVSSSTKRKLLIQRNKKSSFNPKNIFLGTNTGYAFWKLFYNFVNYFYDSLVLEEDNISRMMSSSTSDDHVLLNKRKVHLLEYVTTKFCNCFVKKIVDIPHNQTTARNLLLSSFEKLIFYAKFKKISFLSTVSKLIVGGGSSSKQSLLIKKNYIPKNSVFLTFFHMFLYLFEYLGRKEDYERKQFIECFFYMLYFDVYHTRFMSPRDRRIYLQITKSSTTTTTATTGDNTTTTSPSSPSSPTTLEVPQQLQPPKQQKRKSFIFGSRKSQNIDRVKKQERRRSGGSSGGGGTTGSSGRLTLLLKQCDPETLRVIDCKDNSEPFNLRGLYLIGKLLFLLREYEAKKRQFDVQETLLNIYELLPLLKSVLRKYYKELKSTNEKLFHLQQQLAQTSSSAVENLREDRAKGDFLLEYKLVWENQILNMEPFETLYTLIEESKEKKRSEFSQRNRSKRENIRRQVRQHEEESFEKFIQKMDFLKQQSKILKYRENNVIKFTGLSVNKRYKEKISNRMWNAKKKEFTTENGVFFRKIMDTENNIFSLKKFILAKEEEIQMKKVKKKLKLRRNRDRKKSTSFDFYSISPISSEKNNRTFILESDFEDEQEQEEQEEEYIRVILCEDRMKKKRFIDVCLEENFDLDDEEEEKKIRLKLAERVVQDEEKTISVIMKPQSVTEKQRIERELRFISEDEGEEEEDPKLRFGPRKQQQERKLRQEESEEDEGEEDSEDEYVENFNREEIDWDDLEKKLLDQKLYVRDEIENNSRMKFRFICVNNTERRNYFENRHVMKGARLRELIRQRANRRRQDSSSFVSVSNLGSSIAEEDEGEIDDDLEDDDVVGSDEFSDVDGDEEFKEDVINNNDDDDNDIKPTKTTTKSPNLTIKTKGLTKSKSHGHKSKKRQRLVKSPISASERRRKKRMNKSKIKNKRKRASSVRGRSRRKEKNEGDVNNKRRRRSQSSSKKYNNGKSNVRKRRESSKNRSDQNDDSEDSVNNNNTPFPFDDDDDEEEEEDTMTSEVDDDDVEEEEDGIDEIDLNPFHTTDEKRLFLVERCERITPFQPVIGSLEITNKSIYFMPLPEMYQPSLASESPSEDVMNSPSSTSPNFKKKFFTNAMNISTDSMDNRFSGSPGGKTLFLREYQKSIFSIFWFPLSHIRYVQRHRYLYQYTALEFFLVTKRSVLFNFSQRQQPNLLRTLSTVILKNCFPKFKNSIHQFSLVRQAFLSIYKEKHPRYNLGRSKITQLWVDGKLSNFDYLMQLNTFACRSYNDISQYPIFPWVLRDYESEELDLGDPGIFRDLSQPMGVVNKSKIKTLEDRYNNWMDQTVPAFHYGSHYSSSAVPVYFLIRNEPYTSFNLKFQGGYFDLPDRLFHSVKESWDITQNQYTDVKELIPEFYYFPDFLKNIHTLPLGKRQDGKRVHNVVLPRWAKGSPEEFVRIHREALESRYVSAHLHEWIDLIFGCKQRGPNAVKSMNIFYYLTYEHLTKPINEITDPTARKSARIQIMNFGQTPPQMFLKPHPKKKMGRKSVRHLAAVSKSFISSEGVACTTDGNNVMNPSDGAVKTDTVSSTGEKTSTTTNINNAGMEKLSEPQNQQQQQQQKQQVILETIPKKKVKKRGHKIPLFEFSIDVEGGSTSAPMIPSSLDSPRKGMMIGEKNNNSSTPNSPTILTPSPILSNPPPRFPSYKKYRPRDQKNRCTVVSLTWVNKSRSQASPGPGILRTLPLSMVPTSYHSHSHHHHHHHYHSSSSSSSQATPLFVIDTRRKFRQFSYFRSRMEGEGKTPIGPSFSTDFLISTQTFCVTRNGKFVISCGHFDCTIKVSSIDSKSSKGSVDVKQSLQHHKEVVTCVKLGEEENFLVSGSMDCTVNIWRLNKRLFRKDKFNRKRRKRRKTQMVSNKADHHPLLAMKTHTHQNKKKKSEKNLRHVVYHNTLFGHEFPVSSVEINEDLDLVVSGDIRGSVKIFSLIEGKYIRTIQHPNHCRIQDLLISRRNANLIIYSKKDSILYQYSLNGHLIRSLIVPQLNHIVFSSFYSYIIGGGKKSILVFPFFNIECFEEFYFLSSSGCENNNNNDSNCESPSSMIMSHPSQQQQMQKQEEEIDDEITCIESKDEFTFVVGTKLGRIQYYNINYQDILNRKKKMTFKK